MNPCKALRRHRADPQIQRHQRRVLPAGALAVVAPGHQHPAFFRLRPCREGLVHRRQAEIAQVRNVAAVGQQLRVAGHDVVRGDVVLHLQQHFAANRVFQVVSQRKGLDVRSPYDFHRVLRAFRRRRNHKVVVHVEARRHLHRQVDVQSPRIRQHAGNRRHCRRFTARQINPRGCGPAAGIEIPVVRANGNRVRLRALPHADARAACAFENPRAGVQHVRQRAVFRQHGQHLLASRPDHQAHVRMHGLALQNPRHPHHVLIAAVGAAADENLVHLDRPDLFNRFHVVRQVRPRHQRHQLVQLNLDHFVVCRVRVGAQLPEVLLPALGLQESPGHLVAGENGSRRAKLRAHVRNGRPLRYGQAFHALADVFHHLARAALDAQPPQHFENNVLRRHGVGQFPRQLHAHDLRAGQVVGPSAHGHRHVQAAGPDGQHADAAAGGRVAVAAEQSHPRNAEALQLHLVADPVPGLRAPDPVLLRNALDVLVVVRVFKTGLQRVVVDVGHAPAGLHPADPHGFKLKIRHRAGAVLGQGLVNPDGNFLSGRQFPADQMVGQNFLCQVHAASLR